MRIGIDLRLYSYRPGGIGRYAFRLAQTLARRQDRCALTVFQSRKATTRLIDAPTRTLYTPCHHRFEQQSLAVELYQAPIDLLHSPDFIPPLRRTFRSVISVHDLSFRFFPQFLTDESRRYYGQIEKALASADAVLTDAAATKHDLAKEFGFPQDKVTVTYLGVDESFRPLPDEDVARFCEFRGIPRGAILCFGTLEPRKNVATLLRAYSRLKKPPPLVLGGQPGWLFDETMDLIDKLGIRNRVAFFRPTSDDDVPLLYNAASVVAVPSLYEGFGFSVVEAMACGTPVVCSNAGSLPEVAGDAAIQIDPNDEAGLADALRRVLHDKTEAAAMRERGFPQAAKFNWERCTDETLAVYEQVLAA